MTAELPPGCRELIARQCGVISLQQAMEYGFTPAGVRNLVRRGKWQQLRRAVYATFGGPPTREAVLWAALLRAGPDAVLSHQSAAERHGLLIRPSQVIHVAVARERDPARSGKISGVVIHRSDAVLSGRHPVMSPPCTRIEDTVLDLVKVSRSPDEAYDWICKAIGGRRTTAGRLRKALDSRARFPGRRNLEVAIGDTGGGALSWLERNYVTGVERPHALPLATRQFRVPRQGGQRYLDNLYEDYLLCVELDGTAAHPASHQWQDKRRDRANLATAKIVTVRVGYLDICDRDHQCQTAAELARILTDRGPAVGRACDRPGCPVATS